MARTEIRGGQIKDDSITGDDIDESTLVLDKIRDADGDTKVQVEESADEDKIRFDTAGLERMIITNAGAVGIGTSSPDNTLHVKSPGTTHIKIESEAGSESALKLSQDGQSSAYVWMPGSTSDLRFYVGGDDRMHIDNSGNVGIGTTSPDYTLDVAGDIGVDQKIYHNGDANTYINFTDDRIRFEAGGLNLFGMHKKDSAPHQVTVNNGNNNVDFVVNTNDANTSPLLRCDASAGKVGIGTATPSEILTLNATEATILFEEGGTDMATIGINSSDNILIENKTMNKHIVFKVNDQGAVKEGFRLDGAVPEVVVNQTSESLVDFRVESDNNTHMLFVDGSNNNIGVNTDAPVCELDVNGTTRTKAFGVNVRDVNSTSSVQATDYCLRCVQTGAITITLPAKAQSVGRVLVFKDTLGNANTNPITLAGDSSDRIDGALTYIIDNDTESVTLICDGINGWMITSKYAGGG